MRDFFINSLEKILNVIVIVMVIATVVASLFMLFAGGQGMGNILLFVLTLAMGALYTVLFAGMAYLGLGIYQNTKRTAELLERQLPR